MDVSGRRPSAPILALVAANLLAINLAFLWFASRGYPLVGSDYGLAIPQFLDSYLHFRTSGLAVQWYTATFGAGLPAYPDPNNAQFSLFVALLFLMSPWKAVLAATAVFVSLGFVATYRLCARVMGLSAPASLLGAAFFSANGFMMTRIAVGHAGYVLLPLISVLLLLLVDRQWSVATCSALLGLLVAVIIHDSGYFVLVVAGLTALQVLPVLFLVRSEALDWSHMFRVGVLGAIFGLLLSLSKLMAVYSFMRFFPRVAIDVYNVGLGSALTGLGLELMGTMVIVPVLAVTGWMFDLAALLQRFSGADYGFFEFDTSLSPIIFPLLAAGAWLLAGTAGSRRALWSTRSRALASLLLAGGVWVSIEFTLARGLMYPQLRMLPILKSMHVNARFASAFILPISLLAAVAWQACERQWPTLTQRSVLILVNALLVAPLAAYFFAVTDLADRRYDVTPAERFYDSIAGAPPLAVTAIDRDNDNTKALISGRSNLNVYQPIFGYDNGMFAPEVHEGSVWEVSDGAFNMTNPAGLVYPEVNHSRPWARIPVSDRGRMEVFVRHGQPDWPMSASQHAANWVSGLSLLASLLYLGVAAVRGRQQAPTSR